MICHKHSISSNTYSRSFAFYCVVKVQMFLPKELSDFETESVPNGYLRYLTCYYFQSIFSEFVLFSFRMFCC